MLALAPLLEVIHLHSCIFGGVPSVLLTYWPVCCAGINQGPRGLPGDVLAALLPL